MATVLSACGASTNTKLAAQTTTTSIRATTTTDSGPDESIDGPENRSAPNVSRSDQLSDDT
jgi:hypothetical protein